MTVCPACGLPAGPSDSFCQSCGNPLPTTPVQTQYPTPSSESNAALSGGGAVGAAGSVLMFIQNLMIVVGILIIIVALGNILSDFGAAFSQSMFAVSLIFFSFYVDYVGLLLMGVGLIVLTLGLKKGVRSQSISSGTMALGLMAGILCIAWVVLTILWRVVYPQTISDSFGSMMENVFSLDPGAVGNFRAIYDGIKGMMYVWIAASVVLVVASLLFSFFLARVRKEVQYDRKVGSASWPVFTIINAVGTALMATFILSAMNLSLLLGNLLAGAVIKGLIIPSMALYVYYSLTRKLLRLRVPSAAPVAPYAQPVPYAAAQPVAAAPAYAAPGPYVAPLPQAPPPATAPPVGQVEPPPPMDARAQPQRACPQCGAPAREGDRFCMSCGSGLGAGGGQ